jgi:hypothetical protein
MVPLTVEKVSNETNGVSNGLWPNPQEQFKCECTHFLEQISNALIFSPAVSNSLP